MKKLFPLIIIFSIIILFTIFVSVFSTGVDLFFVLRTFMGTFFIVFGGFKVIKLSGFAKAYRMYDLIAARSEFYSYLYPFIELALGLAYFTSFELEVVNWITLIVMLVSALGVFNKLRKREEITCACLGTVFKIPMTWVTLLEDLIMAGMALIMILI